MPKLSEFNVSEGNWKSYCDRLEMYFIVNGVKPELKLPTLLAFMGETAYELLVNLCSPTKPANSTYAEVVKLMGNHLQPRPSVLAERYKFRQRRQQSDESISGYVAELKKLSRHCDFESNLEDNLRDQFACGIKSEVIRRHLFAEEKITFNEAVKLATSLEAAESNAAIVQSRGDGFTRYAAGAATSTGEHGVRAERRSISEQAGAVHRMQVGGCSACGDYRHTKEDCKFKKYECHRCRKIGHLRRMCYGYEYNGGGDRAASAAVGRASAGRARGRGRAQPRGGGQGNRRPATRNMTGASRADSYWLEDDTGNENDQGIVDEEPVYQMSLSQYRPVSIMINVNDVILPMEIDTGSPLSCISYDTYKQHFSYLPIQECKLSINFYNGSKVSPIGFIEVQVIYNDKCKVLDLYIFRIGTTTLLGRQWISEMNIVIPKIPVYNHLLNNLLPECRNDVINDIVTRYKELFEDGLGTFTGGRATLHIREGAQPVFCRARPLPYALRARVDAELDCMLKAGVIEPVDTSDWATPLVIVHKADGALRICADYKITLNRVLKVDKYPVPKIEDLLAKLSGHTCFSKLDLSQAYNQILLDDSRELTVINTHKGLFRYNRLVYGLSSSPGIFQRIMTKLFDKVPNVTVFLDDILISSSSIASHIETLNRVLSILQNNGLKVKKQKCEFLKTEVKYLGFRISKEGVKVDTDKIEPIINLSPPTNVSELKSFLGMINFYGKFIKNLSFHLSPLYQLLKKGKHWFWDKDQSKAFETVKKLLISSEVLAHYDESLPVVLTCDASAHGIGAVLAQRGGCAGARERPLAYASRALTSAERHYSQIQKEALAIVFAVKKFHQYLYGRSFVLRTDHKPLVSIFGSESGVPNMTASRLQRWALLLSAYDFSIEYVKTDANTADALSRLVEGYKARSVTDKEEEEPEQTYLHFASEALLLSYENIRDETKRDPILSRVFSYVRDGWPAEVEIRELKPYFNRRSEVYVELGCLMWGHRLIVPKVCQNKVLAELHDTHMGIVRTKSIARSYVWWPGLDEAVEALCRSCAVCAETADAPTHHEPQPWPWPTRPWSRLHIDFLGPFAGYKYLIMVDAQSKWLEVCKVNTTTAKAIIEKIREIWARFGIPKQIVSDNGPPFSSAEFNSFLNTNGVEHIYSAPYHPASNGLAENSVRTCKSVIKKAIAQKLDVEVALQRFLLIYRNTEHSTTKESPAQLLQGRSLRTRLDRLKPARDQQVAAAQQRQQRAAGGVRRAFRVGDTVWCRIYQSQRKWIDGRVLERIGSTDYKIELMDGTVVHRHADQLKIKSKVNSNSTSTDMVVSTIASRSASHHLENQSPHSVTVSPGALEIPVVLPTRTVSDSEGGVRNDGGGAHDGQGQSLEGIGVEEIAMTNSERRYPVRIRKPPERYGFQ